MKEKILSSLLLLATDMIQLSCAMEVENTFLSIKQEISNSTAQISNGFQQLPKELFFVLAEHLPPAGRSNLFSTCSALNESAKQTYYPLKYPHLVNIHWYNLLFETPGEHTRFNHLLIRNLKKFHILCNIDIKGQRDLASNMVELSKNILQKIEIAQLYFNNYSSDPAFKITINTTQEIYKDWKNSTSPSLDSRTKRLKCTIKKALKTKSQPLIPLMNWFISFAKGELEIKTPISPYQKKVKNEKLSQLRGRDWYSIQYDQNDLTFARAPSMKSTKEGHQHLKKYGKSISYFIKNHNQFSGVSSELELHRLIFENWNDISDQGIHGGPFIIYSLNNKRKEITIPTINYTYILHAHARTINIGILELEGKLEAYLQDFKERMERLNNQFEASKEST